MKSNSTFRFGNNPMLLKTSLVHLVFAALIFFATDSFSQVSINVNGDPPDSEAMLDVSATDKGVLIPRVTFANRPPSTKIGMLIYQTNGNAGFYYCNGLNWIQVGDAAEHFWQSGIGNDIGYSLGKVYIGSTGVSDGHGLNVQNYTNGGAAVHGIEQNGVNVYSEGFLGLYNFSFENPNPYKLPLSTYNIGVLGLNPPNGGAGVAVYGWNDEGDELDNYAGVFIADGPGTNNNVGVYARADSGSVNYGVEANATGSDLNYAVHAHTDNGSSNFAGRFKGRVQVESHNGLTNAGDSTATLFSADVIHNNYTDTRAISGTSQPVPGYGYGVYGTGSFVGVYGRNPGLSYGSTSYGVYGYSTGSAGTRYGVFGYAYNSGGNAAYGVYGTASGATTNWAGYFASGAVFISNDLRIGTVNAATGYKLSVDGKVACEEVLVENSGTWPDYVFLKGYKLLSLNELENEINTIGHLPGIPSAEEIEENGFELADMQKRVLEKVEELTLYTIEQQKLIKQLQERVDFLEEQNEILSKEDRNK